MKLLRFLEVKQLIFRLELTGDESKINAHIKLLEEYEIKELVRTGVCALERGANDITDYCEIFNQLGGSKWQVASDKW